MLAPPPIPPRCVALNRPTCPCPFSPATPPRLQCSGPLHRHPLQRPPCPQRSTLHSCHPSAALHSQPHPVRFITYNCAGLAVNERQQHAVGQGSEATRRMVGGLGGGEGKRGRPVGSATHCRVARAHDNGATAPAYNMASVQHDSQRPTAPAPPPTAPAAVLQIRWRPPPCPATPAPQCPGGTTAPAHSAAWAAARSVSSPPAIVPRGEHAAWLPGRRCGTTQPTPPLLSTHLGRMHQLLQSVTAPTHLPTHLSTAPTVSVFTDSFSQ